MKIAVPELRILFLRDYREGRLLTYKLGGREKAGRGPIIVLIDNSSSMMGEKEIWSKAVALGIFTIAYEERRDFIAIHFSSAHDPLIEIEIKPKGNNIPQKIYEFVTKFIGGGTDFEKPLSRAVDLMKNMPKADIIMISDGICGVGEEWLKQFLENKKKMDFKVLSIIIGEPGASTDETLRKFSDKIYNPLDLEKEGDEVAVDVFGIL